MKAKKEANIQTESTTVDTSRSATSTPVGSKTDKEALEKKEEAEKATADLKKDLLEKLGVEREEIENNDTSRDATISKSTLLSLLLPDNDDQIKETIMEITASLHSQESHKNLSNIITSLETANFNLENLDKFEGGAPLPTPTPPPPESPKIKEQEKQENTNKGENKSEKGEKERAAIQSLLKIKMKIKVKNRKNTKRRKKKAELAKIKRKKKRKNTK